MLIHKERLTGTTASGSLTKTTLKFSGVLCKQFFVKPATATTTYNVQITDRDGDVVFEELAVQGTLNRELDLPLNGSYTINVTSASADEAFTMFLGVKEKD